MNEEDKSAQQQGTYPKVFQRRAVAPPPLAKTTAASRTATASTFVDPSATGHVSTIKENIELKGTVARLEEQIDRLRADLQKQHVHVHNIHHHHSNSTNSNGNNSDGSKKAPLHGAHHPGREMGTSTSAENHDHPTTSPPLRPSADVVSAVEYDRLEEELETVRADLAAALLRAVAAEEKQKSGGGASGTAADKAEEEKQLAIKEKERLIREQLQQNIRHKNEMDVLRRQLEVSERARTNLEKANAELSATCERLQTHQEEKEVEKRKKKDEEESAASPTASAVGRMLGSAAFEEAVAGRLEEELYLVQEEHEEALSALRAEMDALSRRHKQEMEQMMLNHKMEHATKTSMKEEPLTTVAKAAGSDAAPPPHWSEKLLAERDQQLLQLSGDLAAAVTDATSERDRSEKLQAKVLDQMQQQRMLMEKITRGNKEAVRLQQRLELLETQNERLQQQQQRHLTSTHTTATATSSKTSHNYTTTTVGDSILLRQLRQRQQHQTSRAGANDDALSSSGAPALDESDSFTFTPDMSPPSSPLQLRGLAAKGPSSFGGGTTPSGRRAASGKGGSALDQLYLSSPTVRGGGERSKNNGGSFYSTIEDAENTPTFSSKKKKKEKPSLLERLLFKTRHSSTSIHSSSSIVNNNNTANLTMHASCTAATANTGDAVPRRTSGTAVSNKQWLAGAAGRSQPPPPDIEAAASGNSSTKPDRQHSSSTKGDDDEDDAGVRQELACVAAAAAESIADRVQRKIQDRRKKTPSAVVAENNSGKQDSGTDAGGNVVDEEDEEDDDDWYDFLSDILGDAFLAYERKVRQLRGEMDNLRAIATMAEEDAAVAADRKVAALRAEMEGYRLARDLDEAERNKNAPRNQQRV